MLSVLHVPTLTFVTAPLPPAAARCQLRAGTPIAAELTRAEKRRRQKATREVRFRKARQKKGSVPKKIWPFRERALR